MGYDMYQVKPDVEPEVAVLVQKRYAETLAALDAARNGGLGEPATEEARQAFRVACDAKDATTGYFRLNIWGMGTAREQLFPVGVVRDAEHGDYPTARDFGLPDGTYIDEGDDGVDVVHGPAGDITESPEALAWRQAVRDWTDGSAGEGPGIPLYKFGSNDGWLVNPVEIISGLGYADENHPGWRDGLADYVTEFVAYMEASIKTEGFRVY